ncbi:MAG: M3 family metallopeptidase, partial [Cyanobacteria bacterium P01_G01_bin.4]
MVATPTRADNPLAIGEGLPPFDRIQPEHIVPGITQVLDALEQQLTELESSVQPTWSGLVEPLDRISEKLRWSWGIVGHLMGVKNSPELREAYQTMQPKVIELSTKFGQSKPLYLAFKALKDGETWATLDEAQQRIVESSLRQAELAGVGLEGDAQKRFNEIQMELAKLATDFSNHVLDATKAFSMTLTETEEVDGLPPSLLSLSAQAARAAGDETATPENGPWHITLDFPSFGPFLKYSTRRDLREKVYKAYITRASSGDLDNTPLIDRILELRQEKSKLLGFDSFAELSLASKMAPSVSAVDVLMEELRVASYDAAVDELNTLKAFAASKGAAEADDLKQWDTSFWSERQREEKFAFNEEELRPYFPLPRVLDGLFSLCSRIFDIQIEAANGEAPVWHPEVQYFKISRDGEAIAYFYLDSYSRPAEKRGGAWMDECLTRAKMMIDDKSITRLPVAYLTCNQTPPVDDKPSLMTFREVETLFHEFGHGLQHMLTTVDYPGAAGINNVEWDAVELPSQFMENWCYHRDTLFGMAKHYETGETLPEHYYEKLLAARTYMSGSAMLRQLNFSMLDIELHHRYDPNSDETVNDVRDRLAKTTTVMPQLPDDAFLCAFGHIFAGGYAAGYYSYKWAEVL